LFKELAIKTEKNHLIPGHIPFSPQKVPFYYGWIVLLAGALGILFSIPGQTMGVSVYTDHLIKNLNLSRVEISTAYMIGTLTSALIMTKAGIFYDRFGARVAAAGSTVGLGGCLILLSYSGSLSGIISRISGLPLHHSAFALMVVGFLGIRFFGQGVLTLVSRGMVMRWFESHRGFAAALMGIFTSFGFSYAPRVLQGMIDLTSWDKSWMIMGFFMIAAVLPFILIVFRDSPEDCGMEIEESLKIKKGSHNNSGGPEHSYTLQEARKDPRLWCYMALLFFWALYNTAFTFHITSIFSSLGKTNSQAVAIFLPISVISICARFLGSWLSDLIDLKFHYYTLVFSIMMGSIALWLPYNTVTAVLLIFGMGMAGGTFGVLNALTWPKLYGREHLGAISGMAMSFIVAGSAVGPWLFSLMERVWGHYRYTGLMGVGVTIMIGLFSLPALFRKPASLQEI